MKVRRIYMIIVVVGVMVGCTSPRPSPGGEGGILPRPAATPSERGMDSLKEYYDRMELWEMLHGGMSRWESDK
ncbi:MAG: hypothetical protein J6T22_15350 [Bacteroidales bacterium]|nr:hypothetical protein [Bacteroidales bacterium]